MATQVFKDAKAWLAQFALTAYLNELEVEHAAEVLDDTVFGDATRQYASGLETFRFTLNGFADYGDDAQDEIIRSRVGTVVPLTLGVETGLENTRAYLVEAQLADYRQGGAVGALAPFTLGGMAAGGQKVVNGVILEDGTTARTVDGSGTARQLGAVGAAQKLYATLHVLAYSGFTSVVVKVQSDTVGFPTPTDRVTFATVTGLTAQYAAPVTGAIADDYWRVNWDVTGAGSISFVVAVGIK